MVRWRSVRSPLGPMTGTHGSTVARLPIGEIALSDESCANVGQSIRLVARFPAENGNCRHQRQDDQCSRIASPAAVGEAGCPQRRLGESCSALGSGFGAVSTAIFRGGGARPTLQAGTEEFYLCLPARARPPDRQAGGRAGGCPVSPAAAAGLPDGRGGDAATGWRSGSWTWSGGAGGVQQWRGLERADDP
jgi:hypothetical protein